jgi:hypothetical protein
VADLNKTNIYGVGNGENASYSFISFIFFEFVQTKYLWKPKNMKIMKMYEARFIKGIYLPCCIGKGQPSRKHEANMKRHEARRLL